MADDVTTVASPLSSVPALTIISTQQQTDGSHRQNLRILDATKDSDNALGIDNTGAAAIQAPPSLPLPAGASTEATLAAILAKIIAAPSTAANQATEIAALALLVKRRKRVERDFSFDQSAAQTSRLANLNSVHLDPVRHAVENVAIRARQRLFRHHACANCGIVGRHAVSD
jgi:hypothetical protein